MKKNSIKIEVYGGCVTEVTGLPDGWDYEIVDHDHLEELQASSDKQQASSHKLATIWWYGGNVWLLIEHLEKERYGSPVPWTSI